MGQVEGSRPVYLITADIIQNIFRNQPEDQA